MIFCSFYFIISTYSILNSLTTTTEMSHTNHIETKRALTEEEILDIISCVKYNTRIPEEIDTCNKDNIKNIMRKQLEKVSIYPSKIGELKEKFEQYYLKTQVPAGEMVGVLAATSIGEPTTQLALNSFHSSGISKSAMNTGVPRIEALLNAYKNIEENSGIYLYLKDVDNTDIKKIRDVCMTNYEYKKFTDIIESIKILETNKLYEEKEYIDNKDNWEDWHDYYDFMVSTEYKQCNWCFLIKLKNIELYLRKKKISEIASLIEKRHSGLYAVSSSEEECIIIVYVDTSHVKTPNEIIGLKKTTKQNDEELGIEGLITSENKDYYYVRDIVVPTISELHICGIKGIDACYYDQSFGKNKEWKIETKGSNFREVLNHPMTDYTKTISSNMWEIYEVLGIEATRTFLIDELLRIVSVAKRHIIQLVNMMTFFGYVRGANRHGVNSTQVKTLSKITFEEPLKHIKHASLISETDYLNNVSSQLMMGKTCKAGTGIVSLVININQFSDKSNEQDNISVEHKNNNEISSRGSNKVLSHISGKEGYATKIGKVIKINKVSTTQQISYSNNNNNKNVYDVKILGGIKRKVLRVSPSSSQSSQSSNKKELKSTSNDVSIKKDQKYNHENKTKKEVKKEVNTKDDREVQKSKVSSFFKKSTVKSRIFNVDDDNLPIITEKNIEFL